MRNVRVYEEAWPLHTPFVIARGSRSEAKVVVVELEEDGVKGVGECTPYPRYGESIASVMAQVMAIGEQLEAGLTREQLQRLLPAGAARNAIGRVSGWAIACIRIPAEKPGRPCWGWYDRSSCRLVSRPVRPIRFPRCSCCPNSRIGLLPRQAFLHRRV